MPGFFAAIAPFAATIGGALIGGRANKKAAQTAADAQNRATAAILAGQDKALGVLERIRAEGAPGVRHLQQTVRAGPGRLTPAQAEELADFERGANRQLSAGPLAGSGRAVHAIFNKGRTNLVNRFLESNQGRQDRSALALAAPSFGAAEQTAKLAQAGGEAIGAGSIATGQTMAGSQIAQGQLIGSSLGTLAGIVAEDQREKVRDKRYNDIMSSIKSGADFGNAYMAHRLASDFS